MSAAPSVAPTKPVYGKLGPVSGSFQYLRNSPLSVDEVAARLKARIEGAGLWVLNEINPQMLLARGGYEIEPARQILFFHPDLMARVLAADPAALVEAPLKFAVIGLPEGGVTVRWQDPAQAFARYGHPRLSMLGRELAVQAQGIVNASLAMP
jgi:uncharacterized protein (DUF302 family)